MKKLCFDLQRFAEDGIGENLLVGGVEGEQGQSAQAETPVEVTSEPVSEPAQAASEPEKPQLVKVKVNGQEIEKPLEEVLRAYQLEESSRKRFEEAAESKRKLDEERSAWEAEKRQATTASQLDHIKKQAEQDASNFKQVFEQHFGTEYMPIIPGNEWQQAVFQDYMNGLTQQRGQAQQTQMSLRQITAWRDNNPDDAKRVEDAAWSNKDRGLISALDAIEAGSASPEQIAKVQKFSDKVLSAPKAQALPKELTKPQAPVLPTSSAPNEQIRGEDEIDWGKFKSDTNYQSKMFGAYLRAQKEKR